MNTVRFFFFLLFFFSKSFLFTFFVLFSWARSVISHHSIFCNSSPRFSGPQNTRGQAAGRFGRVGIGRSITKGSTHIVVVIFVCFLCVFQSCFFLFIYWLLHLKVDFLGAVNSAKIGMKVRRPRVQQIHMVM